MQYSRIAGKIRRQIKRFSGELSKGISKPARRFVTEAVLWYRGQAECFAERDSEISERRDNFQENRGPTQPGDKPERSWGKC